MKSFRKNVVMLCIGLFFLGVMGFADARAEVVLNDTFEIPAGTSTRADDGADPNDTSWFATTGVAAYLHTADDPCTSRTLMFEGGSVTAVGAFPEVELTDVGDYIRLDVDARFDRLFVLPTYNDYSLKWGLYDSKGTVATGDGQNSKVADDVGYYNFITMNGYYAAKQENPAGTSLLSGFTTEPYFTYGPTFNILDPCDPNYADGYPIANNTYRHSVAMTLTRLDDSYDIPGQVADTLSIDIELDGTRIVTAYDSSATVNFKFNQVAIAHFSHADVYFDNIKVTKGDLTPATCEEAIYIGLGAEADLNEDCTVNFADFAEFAGKWLDCIDPQGCS